MTGAVAGSVMGATNAGGGGSGGTGGPWAWGSIFGAALGEQHGDHHRRDRGRADAEPQRHQERPGALYTIQNGVLASYVGAFSVADGDTLAWGVQGPGDAAGTITVSGGGSDIGEHQLRPLRPEQPMRIERDPAFWTAIAAAPECAGALMGMAPETIGALAANPAVFPLASAHGGVLFARLDAFGFAFEVHTLFTREGWGARRSTPASAPWGSCCATARPLILTYEVDGAPRSKPPRRMGFVPAADWRGTPVGRLRPWVLTKEAWEAAPARATRRTPCQRPSSAA